MYVMFKNHDIYSNMYLFKAHVKHIVVMKYFIIALCPLTWSASVYNFNQFWSPTQILETIMWDYATAYQGMFKSILWQEKQHNNIKPRLYIVEKYP